MLILSFFDYYSAWLLRLVHSRVGSGLTHKYKTRVERPDRNKDCHLLGPFVSLPNSGAPEC